MKIILVELVLGIELKLFAFLYSDMKVIRFEKCVQIGIHDTESEETILFYIPNEDEFLYKTTSGFAQPDYSLIDGPSKANLKDELFGSGRSVIDGGYTTIREFDYGDEQLRSMIRLARQKAQLEKQSKELEPELKSGIDVLIESSK